MNATRRIELLQLVSAMAAAAPSDLLAEVEGLSPDELQFVVDNTNPFERLMPGGLLGESLFPNAPQDELDFKYLKGGSDGGVIVAQVTDHNAEAPLIGRRGAERVSGQIPALKQKRFQDAETLIRLQSQDGTVRQRMVEAIYDDANAVRLGNAARLEQVRMAVLASGHAINNAEEGLVYDVDYGVPGGHKETLAGVNLWSDLVNSDPLGDIEGWQDTMVADQGVQMERAVTSRKAVSLLLQNEKVRKAVFGVNYDRRLQVGDLNAFLVAQGLPAIVGVLGSNSQVQWGYNLIVRQEARDGTRTSVRLFPENKFVMLPGESFGPMGRTFRAPTAEEATRSIAPGSMAIDGDRQAVHVYIETNDPKGLVVLGTAAAWPSFEQADFVFQAQVLA